MTAGRAQLARHLLTRGREALEDAETLLAAGRLRGAALRAADAALDGARALLAPLGLDSTDPAAATLLFLRHLVATDLVSLRCGLAAQQALRARREIEEGDLPALYEARVAALREGAVLVLGEADIVLDRLVGEAPAEPPAAADEDEDEDEES